MEIFTNILPNVLTPNLNFLKSHATIKISNSSKFDLIWIQCQAKKPQVPFKKHYRKFYHFIKSCTRKFLIIKYIIVLNIIV